MEFMQKLRKSAKGKKGFTLIELIIVIAIIAILIALIAPSLVQFLGTAKSTAVSANAKTSYTSAQTFLTQQETKGVTIAKGTYALSSSDGTNISVKKGVTVGADMTITGTDVPTGDAILGIKDFFNAKELKDANCVIVVGEANTLESAQWIDSGKQSGTYPNK